MNEPVHVAKAYDPQRASALAQCWVDQTLNGKQGDFGDSEFACLSSQDRGQFLATHRYRAGPTIGLCYQQDTCGWQAPWGVRESCDPSKPWLRNVNALKRDKHHQLEEVMGLNKRQSAADTRTMAATMAAHSRSNLRAPCYGHDYSSFDGQYGRDYTGAKYPYKPPMMVAAADNTTQHNLGNAAITVGGLVLLAMVAAFFYHKGKKKS